MAGKIVGAEGLSVAEVNMYLQNGAKFVAFQYCISVVFMTFRRSSDIFFVKPGESAVAKGLPYTLLSLVAGWWGIPWGPIFTIAAVATNLRGGKDVTQEVIQAINRPAAPQARP